eukprot:135635_1
MDTFAQKLILSIFVLAWTSQAKCIAMSGTTKFNGRFAPTGELTSSKYPVYVNGANFMYTPEGMTGYWVIYTEVLTAMELMMKGWPVFAKCDPTSGFQPSRDTADVTTNCKGWCIDNGWSCDVNPAISVGEVDCAATVPTNAPTPRPTPKPTASPSMLSNANCLEVSFSNKPGISGWIWYKYGISGDYRKTTMTSYGQPVWEQVTAKSKKFYLAYDECLYYQWQLIEGPYPHCNGRRRLGRTRGGSGASSNSNTGSGNVRIAWGIPSTKGAALTTVDNNAWKILAFGRNGWLDQLDIMMKMDVCDTSAFKAEVECNVNGYVMALNGTQYHFELAAGAQCLYQYSGDKEYHSFYLYETEERWALSVAEPSNHLAVAWCGESELVDCEVGTWNTMVYRMNETVLGWFNDTLYESRLVGEANQTDGDIAFGMSEYSNSESEEERREGVMDPTLGIVVIVVGVVVVGVAICVCLWIRSRFGKTGKATFEHKSELPQDEEEEEEIEVETNQ